MSNPGISFKRMVVGLPQGRANRAAVEVAAELAELLNIELLAAFVADAILPALAGLSGVRELRVLENEWQTLDQARISHDIDRAISVARQRFADIVGGRGIKTGFDVLTGAEAIASLIRADDIVAIIEPAHPGERITWPFTGLVQAAFETAGAVLAVPRRIARTSGPILAVASTSEDPGIRTALQIAAAVKERLILLTAAGAGAPTEVLAAAERLGVQVEHVAGGGPPADAKMLAASDRWQERLRVVSRSTLTEETARLFASLRGIPLLVIEPSRAGIAVDQRREHDRRTG